MIPAPRECPCDVYQPTVILRSDAGRTPTLIRERAHAFARIARDAQATWSRGLLAPMLEMIVVRKSRLHLSRSSSLCEMTCKALGPVSGNPV